MGNNNEKWLNIFLKEMQKSISADVVRIMVEDGYPMEQLEEVKFPMPNFLMPYVHH